MWLGWMRCSLSGLQAVGPAVRLCWSLAKRGVGLGCPNGGCSSIAESACRLLGASLGMQTPTVARMHGPATQLCAACAAQTLDVKDHFWQLPHAITVPTLPPPPLPPHMHTQVRLCRKCVRDCHLANAPRFIRSVCTQACAVLHQHHLPSLFLGGLQRGRIFLLSLFSHLITHTSPGPARKRTGSARIQGGGPLEQLQLLHPFLTCSF